MIWAIHDRDPKNDGDLIFHGEKRGVQSVHLLGPPPVAPQMNNRVRYWDVTLKNVSIFITFSFIN